jgi:tRNA-2-methylthio-N6-dimethylallyladenosine synthase
VGFPGETEADFAATLEVVRRARFAGAFTFQYSKRPGTPAASMPGQVPKPVVQERYDRLVSLAEEISWAENRQMIGRTVEVLVAVGEGRKDAATGRLSGRARDGRLVHFAAPAANGELSAAPAANGELSAAPAANGELSKGGVGIRPGDLVETVVTYAAPHHLNADGPVVSHRRTRAGDAWEAGRTPRTPGVLLGLPVVGIPR